jgi:ankyrin repeat protein
MIDLLISSGLSLLSMDIVGVGPLQYAFDLVRYDDYETQQKDLEYLRWLLSKPELQGPVDARGRSAVHYAVFKNHVAGLKMLLTELGADVGAPDNDGFTPLCAAIEYGARAPGPGNTWVPGCKTEIIEILLEAGASVTTVVQVGGRDTTPLDLAINMEHPCLRLIVDAWLLETGYRTNPNALLVAAAKLGDLELMENVLPWCDSAYLPFGEYHPEIALIHAARKKNTQCVIFLLGHFGRLCVELNTPELRRANVLDFALSCSDLDDGHIINLVRATRRVSIKAWTLLEAIQTRSPRIVALVCKAMHLPHREEALRHKALILAAELSKPETCRVLLKRMDFTTLSHWTALQGAVDASVASGSGQSRLPVFKLLMEQGDAVDNKTVNRAAVMAAHLGHTDVLNHIIEIQGYVICESHPKILEASACIGSLDIIDTLYSQQPELKARNTSSSPSSLLIHAAGTNQRNLVRHLIRTHMADLNYFDALGRTALHYAAAGCCPNMVRLLLKLGADSNSLDFEGSSPFALAATARAQQFGPGDNDVDAFRDSVLRGQLRTMHLLLENGAKVDAQHQGKSILSLWQMMRRSWSSCLSITKWMSLLRMWRARLPWNAPKVMRLSNCCTLEWLMQSR